jgi:hypothetical protein
VGIRAGSCRSGPPDHCRHLRDIWNSLTDGQRGAVPTSDNHTGSSAVGRQLGMRRHGEQSSYAQFVRRTSRPVSLRRGNGIAVGQRPETPLEAT